MVLLLKMGVVWDARVDLEHNAKAAANTYKGLMQQLCICHTVDPGVLDSILIK